MLNTEIIREIEEFIYAKPRSIQEIAEKVNVNWRTADRYVAEIEKELGTVATRVFRGGTRGALKVVYWASMERVSSSAFQRILEEDIMRGKKKEEFSAFDIFQHVPAMNKTARIELGESEFETSLAELKELLISARKQVLIFSGNLSLINLKDHDIDIFKVLEDVVKRNVPIKVISRVDIAGKDNIEKMLSLNFKHGKELIDIRHREQPVRAILVDNKMFRIKEIKEPTGKEHELQKKAYIFYNVKDKDWAEWLTRIFWKMYTTSMEAERRFQEMNKIVMKHL